MRNLSLATLAILIVVAGAVSVDACCESRILGVIAAGALGMLVSELKLWVQEVRSGKS